jgi:hypothetical protein
MILTRLNSVTGINAMHVCTLQRSPILTKFSDRSRTVLVNTLSVHKISLINVQNKFIQLTLIMLSLFLNPGSLQYKDPSTTATILTGRTLGLKLQFVTKRKQRLSTTCTLDQSARPFRPVPSGLPTWLSIHLTK